MKNVNFIVSAFVTRRGNLLYKNALLTQQGDLIRFVSDEEREYLEGVLPYTRLEYPVRTRHCVRYIYLTQTELNDFSNYHPDYCCNGGRYAVTTFKYYFIDVVTGDIVVVEQTIEWSDFNSERPFDFFNMQPESYQAIVQSQGWVTTLYELFSEAGGRIDRDGTLEVYNWEEADIQALKELVKQYTKRELQD